MKKKLVMMLLAGSMLATMPLSAGATEVGTEMTTEAETTETTETAETTETTATETTEGTEVSTESIEEVESTEIAAENAESTEDAEAAAMLEAAEAAEMAEDETTEIVMEGELTVPALTDWAYQQDDSAKTVAITGYSGTATKIKVPATYKINGESYAVVLKPSTFKYNSKIVEVEFEKGVAVDVDEENMGWDGLFYNCSSLEKAGIPEGMTNCAGMFMNCSKLTEVSEIPSGVENCTLMFSGCSSLEKAPKIPEGVTDCQNMFASCSKLTEAPEIPGGVENCSQMFSRCSSLEKAPKIPEGVTNCQYMFDGCTNLTEAPEIPAGVSSCASMFSGCTSLTKAPKIPAGVENCTFMFYDCTSLTEASEIGEGAIDCTSMFSGCTSLTKAPDVPAGAENCTSMFANCESLTDAPDIPEGVEKTNSMFLNCSKLVGDMRIYGTIKTVSGMFKGAATEGDGLTIYYADGVKIDRILATKSTKSKITAKQMESADAITSAGIYVDKQDKDGVVAGMVVESTSASAKEYRWLYYDIQNETWEVYSDWTTDSEWITFNPSKGGDYLLQGEVRIADQPNTTKTDCIGVNHHPYIKGKCQMPYEGGGYLIGLESYDNADYQYEMLILDCTLLAEGKDAWTYTTGKCKVDGSGFWTIWQPEYGYYWTLFRVYDKDGNLIDQDCYGFENI